MNLDAFKKDFLGYGIDIWWQNIQMPDAIRGPIVKTSVEIVSTAYPISLLSKVPEIYRISPVISYSKIHQYFPTAQLQKDFPEIASYLPMIERHSLDQIIMIPSTGVIFLNEWAHSDNSTFYQFGKGQIPSVRKFEYCPERQQSATALFHAGTYKYRRVRRGQKIDGPYEAALEDGAFFTEYTAQGTITHKRDDQFCSLDGFLRGLAPAILEPPAGQEKVIRLKLVQEKDEGIIGHTLGMPSDVKGYYLNNGVDETQIFAGPFQLIKIPPGSRFAQGEGWTGEVIVGEPGDFIVHDPDTGHSTIMTRTMIAERGYVIYSCDEIEAHAPDRSGTKTFHNLRNLQRLNVA